ncbi:hypothetical protein ACRHM7_04070 [Chromohalobacter israelensis]|uniref:hypothetical protein n=1 Tax=Chromohalobacter israelensis TaxID=141390 RepID=UPI003D7A28D4
MRDALRERLHSVLSGEQLRVLALLTPPHSERQERPVREHQATLEEIFAPAHRAVLDDMLPALRKAPRHAM